LAAKLMFAMPYVCLCDCVIYNPTIMSFRSTADLSNEDRQGVGLSSICFGAILEAYARLVGPPLVYKMDGKGIDIGATVQLICGTGVYGSAEVMLAPNIRCISRTQALEMVTAAVDGQLTIGKLIGAAQANLVKSGRAEDIIELFVTRMRTTIE
jgi:hypothetical protein